MPFQTSVRYVQAAGLPGEIAADGPLRSTTFRLVANADEPTAPIAFGRAFSYADPPYLSNPNGLAGVEIAQPGGDNFAGILIHPKEHAAYGDGVNPLAPVYSLPAESWGELCRMGILFVTIVSADAANGVPGAKIGYNADGSLVSYVGAAAPSGATEIPGARLLTSLGASPTGGLAKIELTTI
jgi:hypothetical protein